MRTPGNRVPASVHALSSRSEVLLSQQMRKIRKRRHNRSAVLDVLPNIPEIRLRMHSEAGRRMQPLGIPSRRCLIWGSRQTIEPRKRLSQSSQDLKEESGHLSESGRESWNEVVAKTTTSAPGRAGRRMPGERARRRSSKSTAQARQHLCETRVSAPLRARVLDGREKQTRRVIGSALFLPSTELGFST